MRKLTFLVVLLTTASLNSDIRAEDLSQAAENLSKRQVQSVMEFLSLDHLEGRAPGTRGGELGEHYIKSVLKLLDIEPYGEGYFQEFELRGFTMDGLSAEANGIEAVFRDDIVGSYTGTGEDFQLSAGVVFAGFGITSDAWSWDDYKGLPVDGKILLVRVNEPGKGDEQLFEGDALTYFGRWTYKIEEAVRRGAKGIILIHTDSTAGYGWHVVRNSWGGEELYLPASIDNSLVFRGWMREDRLRDILEAGGRSLEVLYEMSESREFRPVDLGFTMRISGSRSTRSLSTRNVAGYIPAGAPGDDDRAILLSAHTDHLGMNGPAPGDSIFNGAIDNGSAVAAMIMTAMILRDHREELKRPVIVLACEAEEAGLLGSLYFARSLDPGKILCNINYESTPVWEKPRDVMAIGARYSTLEDILIEILKEKGLGYSLFSMSDQGFFYRSDQFSFARRGIPSIWISAGEDYPGGRERLREFFTGAYHTVDDEFDPSWDLGATVLTVKTSVWLIDHINSHDPAIEWKGLMTFPVEK